MTDVLPRLRALCLAYPETTETASWGHPNFRAGKKTFVTYEVHGGQPAIAFRLEAEEVRELCAEQGCFPTPYGRGLWASMPAKGRLSWRAIGQLVDTSYRLVALPRMLAALDDVAARKVRRKS